MKNTYRSSSASKLAILCLVLATVTAFSPAFRNDFVNFDDPLYVTENRFVLGGLTTEGVRYAFTTNDMANWHPLTWLSLQLDAQLFSLQAWGFHLTNVVLHLANTLLLFWVLRRMTASVWRSAAVAALFAVHPLHVESVAWVTERKDVLSTFFALLCLLAYAGYASRPTRAQHLLVLLLLLLSLLAKPIFVTMPFLLLLLDYWPLGRFSHDGPGVKALLWEKTPLLILSACFCVITAKAQREAMVSLAHCPLTIRVENALVAYGSYISRSLWPIGLAAYYPYPTAGLPFWQVGLAEGVVIAMCFCSYLCARRAPYLTVGCLWYLVSLIPMIGLVQVGGQGSADRYTYIPTIGLFIAVVWTMGRPERYILVRYTSGAFILCAIIYCVVLSRTQIAYWHDSEILWSHTIAVTTNNFMAENGVALTLYDDRRDVDKAFDHFRISLTENPRYAHTYALMGRCLFEQGKLREAEAHLRLALRIDPGNVEASRHLGLTLALLGDTVEAVKTLSYALQSQPGDALVHYKLGLLLEKSGEWEEALLHYRGSLDLYAEALQREEKLACALEWRGNVEAANHRRDKARELEGLLAEAKAGCARVSLLPVWE